MRSSFEAAWVVRSGRGERECRAPFEVNRGFSQFRTGAQSGGKPEALRGHRGPSLSLAEPREGLRGRSGAPRGVTRAGSARGEGSDASCGGQIARSRARGVSRRTPPRAPRGAQPPRQLPRFDTATAPRLREGQNWEKNMRRGARGPGRARGVGGAETLGGIARGVGPDAFAAEATSTGRSRAFDHPKPRANSAGGAWITPPPTNARGVNPEK